MAGELTPTPDAPRPTPEIIVRGNVHGVDARLSHADMPSLGPYAVPSTSEIGRLFIQFDASARPLLNPVLEVSASGQLIGPSFGERLSERFGKVTILNYGCGGATDSPLLDILLKEHLGPGAGVHVRNFDLSAVVVDLVRRNEHPHFRTIWDDHKDSTLVDDRLRRRVAEYVDTGFEATGARTGKRLNVHPPEPFAIETFKMKPEFHRRIEIGVGDLRSIDAPNESVEAVMCFNVAIHLTWKDKWLALTELVRVLKPGGFFFSNGTIHEKRNDRLELISGYEDTDGQTLTEGFHSTRYGAKGLEPSPLRRMDRRGCYPTIHESFIGADVPPPLHEPEDEYGGENPGGF